MINCKVHGREGQRQDRGRWDVMVIGLHPEIDLPHVGMIPFVCSEGAFRLHTVLKVPHFSHWKQRTPPLGKIPARLVGLHDLRVT